MTQALHANVVDGGAEYCSVTAVLFLLRYYELCGITSGPLFRAFTRCKKTGEKIPVHAMHEQPEQNIRGSSGKRTRYWAKKQGDKFSQEASLSENAVYNMLMKVFDEASTLAAHEEGDDDSGGEAAARLSAATPHSFRASMGGWAARSRSSNAFNEARLTGRWQFGSRVFEIYWRFGMAISADMVGATRGEDKIFAFKPWPSGTLGLAFLLSDVSDVRVLTLRISQVEPPIL